MNRRKFIKTGLQVGGAGLMASTLGCQGSLFDAFDSPAQEAIVAQTGTLNLYRVNLLTGSSSLMPLSFIGSNTRGIVLLDKNTLLVGIFDTAGGHLYKVDLKNNTPTLLLSNFTGGNRIMTIALESDSSVLVGTDDNATTGNTIWRVNLVDLSVSVITNFASSNFSGIVVENNLSVLALNSIDKILYRINLLSGLATALSTALGTTAVRLAYQPNRKVALIGHNATGNVIRFNLNTSTQLTDIGTLPNGAGQGIALENSQSVLVGDTAGNGLYRVDLDTGVTSRVHDGTLNINITAISVRFQ